MNDPLISVVMPIKDAELYLADALDSVNGQTYQNYEIIVVDDGGDDGGKTIALRYPRVRTVSQTGRGLANAWNTGIASARGPFIAMLDSDDLWTPTTLSKHVDRFKADPALECVVGRAKFFLQAGQSIPPGFKAALLEGDHVAYMAGASMIRRNVFHRVGTFEERWKIASDIEWFARIRRSGVNIWVIDDVLLHKRIHASNLSNVTAMTPVYREELLQLASESVLRQRSARSPDSGN